MPSQVRPSPKCQRVCEQRDLFMRVLVVDPEDSPRRGPWCRQHWDLVIDLGRSSRFSADLWSRQMGCSIVRSDLFRDGVEDLKSVRQMLAHGRRRLIDNEGIDWWALTSLLIAPQFEGALILKRVAQGIEPAAEIWATRTSWQTAMLSFYLERELLTFSANALFRAARSIGRYAKIGRRFSRSEIKEIILDKYDPGYKWRGRFSLDQNRTQNVPVVLIPSAYENSSRISADYAGMLPDQQFLLVATRQGAKRFEAPPNLQVQDLWNYAKTYSSALEINQILREWTRLRAELCEIAEFEALSRAGVFHHFPGWFKNGIRVRDAWREALEREPVCGVLCGDDSNIYTRLPVLLAAQRKIPTVDFHHGAMDGRYLLKDLPCDIYLAKNAMERDYLLRVCGLPAEKVCIAAPAPLYSASRDTHLSKTSIIFFSEPYENAGMRAEEVYREVLPALSRLAREYALTLVVKLHPFESIKERKRLVKRLLPAQELKFVSVIDGPLSHGALSSAWFGITVESTTVLDCVNHGVPCFLMGWLTLSPYGYAQQYECFGVGHVLQSADEIAQIPVYADNFIFGQRPGGWEKAHPETLRHWLGGGSTVQTAERNVS